jgi:hypothetical protein
VVDLLAVAHFSGRRLRSDRVRRRLAEVRVTIENQSKESAHEVIQSEATEVEKDRARSSRSRLRAASMTRARSEPAPGGFDDDGSRPPHPPHRHL